MLGWMRTKSLLLYFFLINVSSLAAAKETHQYAIGEALFQQGKLERQLGEAKVYVGEDSMRAPLSLFACKNCHGVDGKGKREGGVSAPDIRWAQLSKPYRESVYTRESLQQLIETGIKPNGQRSNPLMPRYQLPESAHVALLDYMQHQIQMMPKGLNERLVAIQVVLPSRKSPAGRTLANVLQNLTESYFDLINQQGGVYGRQIEAKFQRADESKFDNDVSSFLLLDLSFSTQASLKMRADTVSIAAYGEAVNARNRFVLYPSEKHFEEILVGYASKQLNIQHDQVVDHCEYSSNAKAIFIPVRHSPACLNKLKRTLEKLSSFPPLLVSNPLLYSQHFEKYPGAIYSLDFAAEKFISSEGRQTLMRLMNRYHIEQVHMQAQLMSLSAARTLISIMQEAGRDLNVDNVVNALETHYDFNHGFGPPVTFGPNRRLGIREGVVRCFNCPES